jgi:hypothetical protein
MTTMMAGAEDIWTTLSGIAGSISLASWIVVLMPQLIENYRTKSSVPPSISPRVPGIHSGHG